MEKYSCYKYWNGIYKYWNGITFYKYWNGITFLSRFKWGIEKLRSMPLQEVVLVYEILHTPALDLYNTGTALLSLQYRNKTKISVD